MPSTTPKIVLEKIIENERRLREAEQLARLGSWELDLKHNKLFWSDEIYRIFDADPQSFGATYEAFLDFVHPDDRSFVNETYTKSVENKEPYGPITHRLKMKNGNVKFVEERGNTTYDTNGTPIRSIGTVQDITERILGEKTKAQLKEKEILLKEIYHRVKNNLQLVSSLLNIQASKIDDEEVRSIFEVNQTRINTISLVHEQLCKSDNLATVFVNKYINDLVENYRSTLGTSARISFNLKSSEATIALDKAVPFGLILNEVVSNSIKHAFPNRDGDINIQIKKSNSGWAMGISDNGIGMDSERLNKTKESFGMEIIEDLTEQLDGSMTITTSQGNGVQYDFSFPN